MYETKLIHILYWKPHTHPSEMLLHTQLKTNKTVSIQLVACHQLIAQLMEDVIQPFPVTSERFKRQKLTKLEQTQN